MFLNRFDMLMSKINYFDIFPNKKYFKIQHLSHIKTDTKK
jgi:hypothetical protein